MCRHEGTRLARYARRLGVGRNPLRRRTDRIEAAIIVATVILLLVAVPLAAFVIGRQADDLALRQAHARQAAEHAVTAVLLQQAPPTGAPDPYTSVQWTTALARWQPPGQQAPVRRGSGPGRDSRRPHRDGLDRRFRRDNHSAARSPCDCRRRLPRGRGDMADHELAGAGIKWAGPARS